MTEKKQALMIIKLKGDCLTGLKGSKLNLCPNCIWKYHTCDSDTINNLKFRYDRAVRWLIRNGYEEDLFKVVV